MKSMMFVSTSCALIIHSAKRNRQLFGKVNHFLKLFISLLVCKARGTLSLFGRLKCSPKECRDPKFLVHNFLFDII